MANINNQKDIDFLLNLKEEDITSSFLMELFGEFKGKRKFNPEDIFTVPVNSYKVNNKPNKNKFTTTVGLWIINKFCFEKELTHVIGYINKPITKKEFERINEKLSYALNEDRITLDQLKTYLHKTQFLTPLLTVITSNHTEKMLMIPKSIEKKKMELIKENKEALANGEAEVADRIEKELIDYAKELLKDDPSADIYNSGARGSYDNNFKNMYISKGAIKDTDPSKGYNIVMSSYSEGIKKEEFATLAKSLAAGPYARSNATALGGYKEKLLVSAMQHVVALPKGSDCGTKRYIEMELTDRNISEMMYSYMIEGSRLVRLDSSNMDKYRGKKVKFRFSSLCESKDGICNRCLGDIFHMTNTTNVGLTTAMLGSSIKLKSMKAFHDSTVKLVDMDVEKAFGFK